MGCAAATAKRRRKQAIMGYTHLPKLRRPIYRSHTKETYERRAREASERRQAMNMRKSRKR
jgi:hypothetical protein